MLAHSSGKPRLVLGFSARENIKRVEAQLAACSDPGQQSTLSRLLEQARQELAEAEAGEPRPASQ